MRSYFQASRPRLPLQARRLPGLAACGTGRTDPINKRPRRRRPGQRRPPPEEAADISGRQRSRPSHPGYDSFKPIILWRSRILPWLFLRSLENTHRLGIHSMSKFSYLNISKSGLVRWPPGVSGSLVAASLSTASWNRHAAACNSLFNYAQHANVSVL